MRFLTIIICIALLISLIPVFSEEISPIGGNFTGVPTEPTITIPTITPEPGSGIGFVSVNSIPQGADLYFDDDYQGGTPALVKVYTTANPSHTIRISSSGFFDWTSSLDHNPEQDQIIPITASLVPKTQFGSIYLTTSPSGAYVSLDGGIRDVTPCTFRNVVPGIHTITASLSGYSQYSSQVQVTAAGQSQFSATLNPVQNTGNLQVFSTPSGADVTLDNNYKGQTPILISAWVGSHQLSVEHAGYQIWSSQVTIMSGQLNTVTAPLTPQKSVLGGIQVTSSPAGAAVYLNSDYEGQTPFSGYIDISDLKPGSYQIQISHPQNEDYVGTVAVTGGQISTVNVALKAAKVPATVNGTLLVQSNPSGAEVFINNQFKGITPVNFPGIPPGNYTVTFRDQGYVDLVKPITITAGQTTDLTADLTIVTPSPTQTEVKTQTPTPTPRPTETPLPLIQVLSGVAIGAAFIRIKGN